MAETETAWSQDVAQLWLVVRHCLQSGEGGMKVNNMAPISSNILETQIVRYNGIIMFESKLKFVQFLNNNFIYNI